jgi:hypothetical protein
MVEQCAVCNKVSDRKNHWRHINKHKKELIDSMSAQVLSVVRKWAKPIVWVREGEKSKWAYCINCLVGTTCTSARMSDVDLWIKRHLYVCKADWKKYEAMYEPQKSDPKSTELFLTEQLQQTISELRAENTQLKARLDEITIKETEERTKVAEKSEMEKHTHTKCWICDKLAPNKQYEIHVQSHRAELQPMTWFKFNVDEFSRMLREGPVSHSPKGKIGYCTGCSQLIPIAHSANHVRLCKVSGESVMKWWKTAQDNADFRPVIPKVEVMNQIVGNPEMPHAPPTTPTLSVQTDSTETLSRNEIHHDSSDSENAPAESEDDDWETRSDVSCSPMDYWDMDNDDIRTIFGVLSDILEQGMECNVARKEYRETLKRLKPKKDSIGKPYKVLQAYILADYTKKDLGNFMSLQD